MNNKIEIIKALATKAIEVTIVDITGVTHKCYIYNYSTSSCVVTKTYVNHYIVPRNRDDNFMTIQYADIDNITVFVE